MKRNRRISPFVTALMVGSLLFLGAAQALADGTETLGPPSINIEAGSGTVSAGIGLQAIQPGEIIFDVPLGVDVKQVLLYWEGQMKTNVAGDDQIVVNGNPVTDMLIGGPTHFHTESYSSSFRADITALGLVAPGPNKLVVDELDFNKANNGAGVVVIFDDQVNTAEIGIRDGVDLAYINFPEPRKSTILQTFTFLAASEERFEDAMRVNLDGGRNVLEACRARPSRGSPRLRSGQAGQGRPRVGQG